MIYVIQIYVKYVFQKKKHQARKLFKDKLLFHGG